ncbi:unnamed protein product [Staurois parvus]|uniref:V-SNARE coiled-coil homology domain-containing protein n=1 Tax=Staurois parvus TaxID=386267 RepID=A0ABN9C6Q9_9NEOB|nr:unnamed protein product [Staurois parvus]
MWTKSWSGIRSWLTWDDRADALQAGASQFETSAARLKRKYWWKNCKVSNLIHLISFVQPPFSFIFFFFTLTISIPGNFTPSCPGQFSRFSALTL